MSFGLDFHEVFKSPSMDFLSKEIAVSKKYSLNFLQQNLLNSSSFFKFLKPICLKKKQKKIENVRKNYQIKKEAQTTKQFTNISIFYISHKKPKIIMIIF